MCVSACVCVRVCASVCEWVCVHAQAGSNACRRVLVTRECLMICHINCSSDDSVCREEWEQGLKREQEQESQQEQQVELI